MGILKSAEESWNSAKQAVNRTVDKWAVQPNMGSTRNIKRADGQAYDGVEKYNVSSHSYPDDLLDDTKSYGGNYVIFYINVAVDSKLAKSLSEQDFVSNITPRDRGDLIAQNLTKDKLFAGAAALNVGGAVLGKALGVGGGASATAAGLATVGAGATALMAASATRAQRRLKTAIAMHVPNQLSIRYGMQWSEDDTGALAMATTAATELMSAVKNKDAKNLSEPAKAIITNIALSKGPNAAGMSAATGLAANPKKEQIFKGVDFRSFTFDYQFFPRDAKEAQNVLKIIYEFKYHMHPEFKDNNNFIYIYPSEFDIFYYQNGQENMNIHRHTSCVLKELNVNYTPNGAFTTFDNGMPTQINVTMNFQELALLTKDKVKDGL
jgi:hypothetical protein